MERGRIQGLVNFLGTPIISGAGKATDFKFCKNIHSTAFLLLLLLVVHEVAEGLHVLQTTI